MAKKLPTENVDQGILIGFECGSAAWAMVRVKVKVKARVIWVEFSGSHYSRTKNKWDYKYKGLEIIVSHWSLRDAAREILTF